jgi:hypothetical protein
LLDAVAFWYRVFHGDFRRALAIVRAGLHVVRHWRSILSRRRESQKHRRLGDRDLMQRIYRRSIVWDYFIAGRKFFSMLPSFPSSQTRQRLSRPALVKNE